jgi:hypothetical protein
MQASAGCSAEQQEGDRRQDLEDRDRLPIIGFGDARIASASTLSATSLPPPGAARR